MSDYHTAIIGAGSAGITVAVGLSGFGKKVALIEAKHVGGDCTNVGCIPSKLLIHLAAQAQGSPAQILAQVRERRDRLRDEESEWIRELKHVSYIQAQARFTSSTSLELSHPDGRLGQLSAKNIVIATGSSPILIPIEGLPEARTLSNESLFDLEDLPAHLVIIGAGVIGCEMAFAFRKLGAEVSLVDLAPRILSILEPEVSELLQERLEAQGIRVIVGAKASRYHEAQHELVLNQDGQEFSLTGVDKVLIAIGRKPNLDLGLDIAGVRSDKRGIPTNPVGRSNIANIYAIGDVNHRSAFTHSANAQGRRLVQKLALPFLPVSQEVQYPSATFTDPEIAQVGPNLAELQQRYPPELIRSYRHELSKTDRAYTQGLEHGFVLIHAMRLTGRVLSATIVAPQASEMISLLTLAVNRRLSMYQLANLVFPYPVLSEAIKKAADAFVFATLPKLPSELGAYLRQRWRTIRPRT